MTQGQAILIFSEAKVHAKVYRCYAIDLEEPLWAHQQAAMLSVYGSIVLCHIP